jgi:hypothetical protein
VTTEAQVQDQRTPAPPLPRWVKLAIAAVVLGLVIVWLFIDWEWSTVDDPGQVILLAREIQASGWLGGMTSRAGQLMNGDVSGGTFRPLAWVYPVLVYQLPVEWAHVVRLAMILIAIAGPIAFFRRLGASTQFTIFALILMIGASSTLYQGLFLISIQELGGAAFIGLGLLLPWRATRIAVWLLAALFKPPFAWFLVAYALYLWTQRRRAEAVVSGILGVAVLAISTLIALSSGVTENYPLDPLNPALWNQVAKLIEPMNALLLVSVVWWVIASGARLRVSRETLLFGFAWLAYTAQMLPWGISAYYMGPISYTFGLLLLSLISLDTTASRSRILIGYTLPIILSAWLVRLPLTWGFTMNSVVKETIDCLAPYPGTQTLMVGNLLYVTSSPEGPIQIEGRLQREFPGWDGMIRHTSNFDAPTDPDFLLAIRGADPAEITTSESVCSGTAITLYRWP